MTTSQVFLSYKKIRPGEPLSVDSAESLINAMFFDPRRYDLAKVGRYKFNKKLNLRNRIAGQTLADDVVDTTTGEVLAEAGTVLTKEQALDIQNAAVPFVWLQCGERRVKVLSNMMVDITKHVDITEEEAKELGVNESVFYPVLSQILAENSNLDDIKAAIRKNIGDLIPKHITIEDIMASMSETRMTSITLATDVFVRLVSFYRISTESVFQEWSVL